MRHPDVITMAREPFFFHQEDRSASKSLRSIIFQVDIRKTTHSTITRRKRSKQECRRISPHPTTKQKNTVSSSDGVPCAKIDGAVSFLLGILKNRKRRETWEAFLGSGPTV